MKEKIINYLKGLPSKYGWKFWACIVFSIMCAISGWQEEGFLQALYGLVGGPIVFIIIYYLFKGMWKFIKGTGKVAGKTAVVAGKTAVFAAAAGAASNKGKGLAEAINEGGKALDATNRLFGKETHHSSDLFQEDVHEQKSLSQNETKLTSKKEVKKVWTCVYTGPQTNAPSMVNVPSIYTYPKPSASEIQEALINLGYDKRDAFQLASCDNYWDCK